MEALKATKMVALALVSMMVVLLSLVALIPAAEATTTLPEGTSFKGASSPQVYVVQNGGYYSVPDPETFNACVGADADIRRMTDAQAADVRATYPYLGVKSCRVSYPTRTTLVAPSSPRVYVVIGNYRFWVTSGSTVGQCLGGDSAIRRISNVEMSWADIYYPVAGTYTCPPTYPDGTTLLAPSSPRVYVIMGGKKYWVSDGDVLGRCLGGDTAIRRISDADMLRTDENYPYAGVYNCPARPPATARNIGYNPFAARYSSQCTYFAEQRMAERTGLFMPVTGHAYQWPSQARAGGWTVGSNPALNSVVSFPAGSFGSSVGHVAWVTGISGNRIYVEDYNWNFVGAQITRHWVTVPAGTQYIYSDR